MVVSSSQNGTAVPLQQLRLAPRPRALTAEPHSTTACLATLEAARSTKPSLPTQPAKASRLSTRPASACLSSSHPLHSLRCFEPRRVRCGRCACSLRSSVPRSWRVRRSRATSDAAWRRCSAGRRSRSRRLETTVRLPSRCPMCWVTARATRRQSGCARSTTTTSVPLTLSAQSRVAVLKRFGSSLTTPPTD